MSSSDAKRDKTITRENRKLLRNKKEQICYFFDSFISGNRNLWTLEPKNKGKVTCCATTFPHTKDNEPPNPNNDDDAIPDFFLFCLKFPFIFKTVTIIIIQAAIFCLYRLFLTFMSSLLSSDKQ